MTQSEKASHFAKLHVQGSPVLLYNAWDAGSAKAIAAGGAKAIATGSWSVAAAQGYADGEELPIAIAETIIGRIAASVDLPVSADFEGGYSDDDAVLAANVGRLLDLGVIGINFEDRVVKGAGLYDTKRQAGRIAAIRKVADRKGIPLFINARTDLFLGRGGEPAEDIGAAIERAQAYAAAGASGFFVPGLKDATLIGRTVDAVPLPVNVMMFDGVPPRNELADLGVARISYGPIPYREAMRVLEETATRILS